ncbi:MAG: DUF4153 domain-containing protein [Pirellulaceae bacterium]|nr:DUF4153 domain-containing protein [Pirellulaceae bacterium]
MSSESIKSFTPENSVLQSFVHPVDHPEDGWRWTSEVNRWNFSSRMKAVFIAILITSAAHLVWRRNPGYMGYSIFILLAANMLFIGVRLASIQRVNPIGGTSPSLSWPVVVILLCLGIGCSRMIWQGNMAVAVFTIVLIGMLSLGLHDKSLTLGRALFHWIYSSIDGVFAWFKLYDCFPLLSLLLRRWPWMAWGIPVAVCFVFLVPLTLAHPSLVADLVTFIQHTIENLCLWILEWDYLEIIVIAIVAAMSLGLLLPTRWVSLESSASPKTKADACSDLVYQIVRNTLIAVIAVFAGFLIFEFHTLWFRVYPPNFHYSGYAHQGAAWLTIVLAMSTILLSTMFSSTTHVHPKLKGLQVLAKLWFCCNLLLVIAVYYRLSIYVGFNGLTRLRIVGYVGVTCVLIGFVLVMYRVLRSRSWTWLINRQLWTLAISLFFLSVLPMDWLSHRWNASQIVAGRLSPAVQIAVQPVSDEGLICMIELIHSEDTILREGILVKLAERDLHLRRVAHPSRDSNDDEESTIGTAWKDFQGSTHLLSKKLAAIDDELRPFRESPALRIRAWQAFRNWAMQWY